MYLKTQNILSVTILVGLLVGGFFLYNQQKAIDEIMSSISIQVPLQGDQVSVGDDSAIVKNNVSIAAGKINNTQDNVISFRLKLLNGKSFEEPLEVVEAIVTKDTSFKIFEESKNKSGDDIEGLANGSISDLAIGSKADFYFEGEMTGDRFEATRIVIIK